MSNSLDAPVAPDPMVTALDLLRGRANPFETLVRPQRPDERFVDLHVPALLRGPRELLLQVIDSYRLSEYHGASDLRDTRVVTVLGARGAGKTHMLEALAHREDRQTQLLVRPSYVETQLPFEEFLLAQLVNALLTPDAIHGGRPFEDIASQLTRRLLSQAVREMGPTDRLFAAAPDGWPRWRLLWGGGDGLAARVERLASDLSSPESGKELPLLASQHGFVPDVLLQWITAHLQRHESGAEALPAIRRQLYLALARAALLRDGEALSRFLEADYKPPNARSFFRGDLVRQLLHALIETCALVQLPVVFAFDNLEGFLAPQGRFAVESSRAFMDSLAQAVDATRGLLFVLFAERNLFQEVRKQTHQFALDRIDQGVPLHAQGPVDLIELKPPSFAELQQLIAERLGRLLKECPGAAQLPAGFPYDQRFLDDLAGRSDLGLRNLMVRLRDEYSRVVYGRIAAPVALPQPPAPDWSLVLERIWADKLGAADRKFQETLVNHLQSFHAGLGRLLQMAGAVHPNGWRLESVRPTVTVGEHPMYGVVTIVDWREDAAAANGNHAPVRVGIGLLLAKGTGMAKDLHAKFDLFQEQSLQVDHLVVLWPRTADTDDLVAALPQATRQVWQSARRHRQAVLRAVRDDDLRKMLAFPEWLDAVQSTAETPVPEEVLRSFVQEHCRSVFPLTLPPVPERAAADAN